MKFSTALIALSAAIATAAPVAQTADDVPDVSGRYIIRLNSGVSQTKHMEFVRDLHARSIEKRQDGRRWRGVEKSFGFGKFHGYSGHFDDDVVKEIEASDDVEMVEADQVWTTYATQTGAPYGIAALSSRNAGSTTYTYDTTAQGTFGYVVDTVRAVLSIVTASANVARVSTPLTQHLVAAPRTATTQSEERLPTASATVHT